MSLPSRFTLAALLLAIGAFGALPEPNPSFFKNATLAGKTFTNKGLVAFGLLPANARDSVGDTLGGIGSAIALKRGSFSSLSNGSFSGTFVVQPDRGFNVDNTVNYQARQHEIAFTLNPYYGTSSLSFADAQKTLSLTYTKTMVYTERSGKMTTGLDADGVRAQQSGFPANPSADPAMPIPSSSDDRLSVDAEGLAFNSDGSYWTSDEYGPYIYLFSSSGSLIQTIQPPDAILPRNKASSFNFSSSDDPHTGRAANQGFEGLTLSYDGTKLFVLLQSATIQDGGDDKSTSRYTRLLSYSVASPPSSARPTLIGEWVVPLPLSDKGNTLECNEVHYLSDTTFLVLARDGDGHGGDDDNSKYRQADLIDISAATDIHGAKFDFASNPIAKKGKLDSSIKPATYVSFVSYIDDTQLARFGVHNGKPADATLLDAKWESLALLAIGDPSFPDDYFLVSAADNDFLTTLGSMVGQSYDAGIDVDNQFLVFRVTLPTLARGSI